MIRKVVFILEIIAIIVLFYFFVWKKEQNTIPSQTVIIQGKPYKVLEQIIDTQYITKKQIVEKKGKDIYHDTTIYVHVPIGIDTLKIISDYFSKKTLKDTLKLGDSLGFVAITDTITKNDILSRKYDYKIIQKLITERTIVEAPKKNELYFGVGAGINKKTISNINGGLLFKSKKDIIYGLGAGVDINNNTFISTSLFWQIKK